jgi:tetratricopeptide (TPR) repeat protein
MALTLARSTDEAARAVDEPALLAELAALAIQRGEAETAELFAQQAIAIVEDERRTLRGRLHRIVAEAHTQRRRFDGAMEALGRAITALGDDGDPIELASALALTGWTLAYMDGRVEEGLALGERARNVASQIDAPEFRARLCGRLGGIYLRAGRWDDQLRTNLEDLGLSASARDVGGVIRSHINLGVCYTNRGLTALAQAHTAHALDLARRYGYRAAEYVAANNLALIAADEQRWADAIELALASQKLAERNDLGGIGETRCTLARAALARGDTNAAEVQIEQTLAGADSEVDHEMATRLEAMLHCARGRPDRATELLREHVETPAPDPYERACTELVFAAALRAMGLTADAARVDTTAAGVLDRLGADPAHERRKWQSRSRA